MAGRDWRRWASWVRPIPVEEVQSRQGTLSVRWEFGRKVLNSVEANQSFGSLHRVWHMVFQEMDLRAVAPANVLLLGLGGGSVVHILRMELGIGAPITAVELDPVMVDLARRHFGLDEHANVKVVQGDATIQVHAMAERSALVVVDLFDGLDLARGVDGRTFAHGLRDRCAEGGTVCFNTVIHDPASEVRSQLVHDHLTRVFNHVEELRTETVNRVFIAR